MIGTYPMKTEKELGLLFLLASRKYSVLFLLVFGVVFVSCESEFEPFESGILTASMYGYLDTAADTQFVRVMPMRRQLQRNGDPFDGQVSITDIDSGQRYDMQDSLVTLSDGSKATVYWAAFKPRQQRRYELMAAHNDGRNAIARVTVPNAVPKDSIYVLPAILLGKLIVPIYLLSHEKPPFDFRMIYEVSECDTCARDRITIRYIGDITGRKVAKPNGWHIEADLIADSKDVRKEWAARHGRQPTTLYMHGMTMQAATVSEGWVPPSGVFDPITMIMPGAHSNVEGGEGFFGAVARYELTWVVVDHVLLDMAGYSHLGYDWGYEHPYF
jgi:hypothetical protein